MDGWIVECARHRLPSRWSSETTHLKDYRHFPIPQ
jgi:hypothetical protein